MLVICESDVQSKHLVWDVLISSHKLDMAGGKVFIQL